MRFKTTDISKKLYISTIAEDCNEMAVKYGIGLEISEFCTAVNMDPPDFKLWDKKARDRMKLTDRFIFHAPFSEIYPSAIDPKMSELAYERLKQAAELSMSYGIKRMVVHGGHLPNVYFPEWFHERSLIFWKRFLSELPEDFEVLIENVLEDRPERLLNLVNELDDPHMGLCFDVGHVSANTDMTVEEWLDQIQCRISHVHIHNNYGGHDRHLPLGEGRIDMKSVITRILQFSPNASFTIESIDAAPSLRWLEEQGFFGGALYE